MRILDLFCGAGGASMGYHLAGFEVVGVDIKPQPRYPFEFHQADALGYPLDGFDAYHASPPCQAYSVCTGPAHQGKHPRMIGPVRERLIKTGRPYVIENVEGARKELITPVMLCGSMFDLPIRRRRYFEIYPPALLLVPSGHYTHDPVYITGCKRVKDGLRKDPLAVTKRHALETPWMTVRNMDEAIPPAYTRFLGGILLTQLQPRRLQS